MNKMSKKIVGMTIIIFIFGLVASAQAEEVNLKILAPWEAAGRVFKVGPELLQFLWPNLKYTLP